jgi:sporulation protein YlmC with PRC-barrel domain
MAMKSPLTAVALTVFACISPALAFGGDHERHPLIGEAPAPMQMQTPSSDAASRDPVTESVRATRQEELVASLVGLRVYDGDENQLGEVTAVLFANDGGVDTLLIRMDETSAVAGHDVALPFDLVTTATGSDGTTVIVVETDGEEIAGAARFVRVDDGPPMPGH